jgi:PAS domain S-box-containing protein
MESTTNVFILIDPHGFVIDSNEAHAKRFGLTRRDIIGKHISSFLPRHIARTRIKRIQEAISTGLPQHGEDIRNGRINEYSITPVKNEMDIFDRVAVYAQDITDRKEAEIKLLQYTEELKDLNATKDKFFSIISHDLSNPLATIIGFCDILQDQIQNRQYEKAEHISAIISKAAAHASSLLQNLTEWARCQTNRISCNPSLISLSELIETNQQLLLESFQQKLLTFRLAIPDNMKVFADKSMIDTVIRNLLSNAIKYSNKGGKIMVSANSDNGGTQICVSDEGVGISAENLHKLFRLDESISTRGTHNEKGTGLGLVLCKEFIKYHGGKIWAESIEGKGTAIYFTLPRPSDLN